LRRFHDGKTTGKSDRLSSLWLFKRIVSAGINYCESEACFCMLNFIENSIKAVP
tara:strand:- start:22727 stop:22888 length:162 start_codon:yes stop_codon:yes gene_type:complete